MKVKEGTEYFILALFPHLRIIGVFEGQNCKRNVFFPTPPPNHKTIETLTERSLFVHRILLPVFLKGCHCINRNILLTYLLNTVDISGGGHFLFQKRGQEK